MRSVGWTCDPDGSWQLASWVMSRPTMARLPSFNSMICGQLRAAVQARGPREGARSRLTMPQAITIVMYRVNQISV